MMVLLNSRMTYGTKTDTMSIELSTEIAQRSVFFPSQAAVSVTYESDSVEHQIEDSKKVSVTCIYKT